MPGPARKTTTIGVPGWCPNSSGREEGRQTEHRAHGEIHVAGEHDHRLADREQRVHGGCLQHEPHLLLAEEARLDRDRDENEEHEDRDDPELANAEDEIDEAPRARPGDLARVDGALHSYGDLDLPGGRRDDLLLIRLRMVELGDEAPSRITRIRSATRSTSGSSDEIIRIATPSPASSSSSRCTSAFVPDVDARGSARRR